MKQIILIRHAKVDIDYTQKIDSASLKKWVDAYDIADIHHESIPTQEVHDAVETTPIVLTSALRRTIDSAKVLGVDIYEHNAIFNEANVLKMRIPFLKLKPKTWLVVLRVLLLLGLGKKDVSLKASKQQARKAVQRLLELGETHESVTLVGHGGMNWLIRKELLRQGWKLEPNASNKNWGMTVLRKEEIKG